MNPDEALAPPIVPDRRDDLEDLWARARSGEVAAMTALGTSLLVGREAPFEPQEGVRLITSAIERGDAQAMSVMATLKAAGAWVPHNLDEAMDLLGRAAEGGSDDAREQLLILAGDPAPAAEARQGTTTTGIWQRLRKSFDFEKWVTPQSAKQVWDWPKVYTAEKFATPELCKWLVGRSLGKFTASMMFNGKRPVFLASRTCSDFSFGVVEGGIVLLLLRIRVMLLTGLRIEQMEPPQIFHYALGQEIKPHYDSLYDGTHGYGPEGTYRGDRLATFLMWLNDDYEGGELEFVKVGFSYKGRAGDGLFFASMRDGKPDSKSLHGANPVTRGEKFILSQWIHDRPFKAS
ncbi:MAG TPA: 2OG-Fe(II) oxygenase [Casimicrobiaceae bacterium]|nr:2OG-Fe(II) oxygenase [Casimicrobiaceae bacterium]